MRRLRWRAARLLGALVLLAPALALAQAPGEPGWGARLDAVETQLRQGQWEPAREAARGVAESLAHGVGGTKGDHRIHADELGGAMASPSPRPEALALARASAFQAVAEAALGQHDAARWHWYAAQNLDRNLRSLDLAAYGEAGAFLRRHVLAPAAEQHEDKTDVLDPIRPEDAAPAGFREPVRTRAVYPKVPQDLRARDRFSHVVFVQVTVGPDGQLVQPLVVDAAFFPGLVYQAFEALREWRYRPATLDGDPIPFRYVVPVVFADDRPEQSAVFFGS